MSFAHVVADDEGYLFDLGGEGYDELFGDGEGVVYFEAEWFLFCPPLLVVMIEVLKRGVIMKE